MKGSKYLSEMVDLRLLRKDRLNMIKAPTGSGKTVFALEHIPSLTTDALHNVVFLIDTINGKEQLLRNPKATSEYYGWAREADENGMWFDGDDRVIIMTYAKFGSLSQRFTDFHANFDYIICDELHSLIKFQNYSPKPNIHSITLMMLKSAVRNHRTTVIALSATPRKIKEVFSDSYYELPIDQDNLVHYEVEQIVPFSSFEYLLSSVDPADTGVCYTSRIKAMLEIEQSAREKGLRPVSIWSIGNKDYSMSEEQLAARNSILQDYAIPTTYNLLIINSSSETSIKIKSPVDYVIVNSSDEDTQVQVRGRVNSDLKYLYLPSADTDPIIVPDEFLGVKLFTVEKSTLCSQLNLHNPYGRPYRWSTVKDLLAESGYAISEGRQNNLRYAIITKSDF